METGIGRPARIAVDDRKSSSTRGRPCRRGIGPHRGYRGVNVGEVSAEAANKAKSVDGIHRHFVYGGDRADHHPDLRRATLAAPPTCLIHSACPPASVISVVTTNSRALPLPSASPSQLRQLRSPKSGDSRHAPARTALRARNPCGRREIHDRGSGILRDTYSAESHGRKHA